MRAADYVETGKQKELAIKKLTLVMALVLGVSGASAFAYDYRNGLDSWRVRRRDRQSPRRAAPGRSAIVTPAITITGINSSRLFADEWIR